MELKTKDGSYFISEQDYKDLHDLKHHLPELVRSTIISVKKCNEQMEQLKLARDSMAKHCNLLFKVQDLIRKLGRVDDNEKGVADGVATK